MKKDLLLLLGWLLIFVAALFVSSCTTERKVNNWLKTHPKEASGICKERFPPIVKYLPGIPQHFRDTVITKGDSIPCPKDAKGKIVKVKCPDVKSVKDSIIRTDTIQYENTAKIEHYKGLYASELSDHINTRDKLMEAKEDNKRLIKSRFIFAMLLVGSVAWSCRSVIKKFI